MSLSVKEIERLLDEHEAQWDSGFFWWKNESDRNDGEHVEGLGKVWVVEEYGGGEGGTEDMHIVFRVREDSAQYRWQVRYFRKDGFYASFGESTWDGGFFEVKPVQRTVTVYEEVKK
ncbi:hypothetical protein [Nocardia grenadensis]|uniref:hypothetical protein n=1 Tax=Nocardia grenadensis TaxID=931537 RepID=UPI003D71D5EC